MSHILIDARESGTTTGRYIDKLIEYLHILQPNHRITVATKSHRLDHFKQAAPNFEVIAADHKEFTMAEQTDFLKQLKSIRPDLVHFGKDHQPVRYKGATVTTMHDLTTMRFVNPDKARVVFKLKQAVYKWVVRRVAKKSNAIIVPSEFVKQDIVSYTGVSASKITVTHEAADQIVDTAEPITDLSDKRFIMYLGRPTPHKNLPRLIEAFKQLKGQYPELRLVLAGKLDANYQEIQRQVQNEQIANIMFTDRVSEGQLRWLFEHCEAYIFPSLSEGFGLPGLEAMVHGAPVISSDATCLPEIYGEAAHYFDPYDTHAIADAISEVLTNKNLRGQLIQNGKSQAAKYSWQHMAEQTLAVYEKVLANNK